MASLEHDLDRLYQVPLTEFTAERNALAKRAGARAAEIRALAKPTLAVWAVNQLYWRHRAVYDALVEAANDLRATHKAVLAGRRGDLRAAGKTHDDALDPALKATLSIVSASGHPVTDATRQVIATTLRGLPSEDPPGRLTRPLQPGGFGTLAGITPSGRVRLPGGGGAAREAPRSTEATAEKPAARSTAREKEREKAKKEAAALAARVLREAEQAARRAEFEAARAARDAEAADERVASAREALEKAEAELRAREREAAAAAKKRDRSRDAAGEADAALRRARERAEAARAEIE